MMKLDNKAIAGRLQELLDDKRSKSSRSYALSIDADPSFFAKVLKGERAIPQTMVDQIVKKQHVSEEWLLFGRGSKFGHIIPHETQPNIVQDSLAEYETVPMKTILSLVESNKVLADANKSLADANKSLANSHETIARGNDRLIAMLEDARKRASEKNTDMHTGMTNPGTEGTHTITKKTAGAK